MQFTRGSRSRSRTRIRRRLSNDERAAFERAWWDVLFALETEAVEREEAPSEMPQATNEVTGPQDQLIYFLEDDEIEAIARLESTPPAQEIRRAFLVRVEL